MDERQIIRKLEKIEAGIARLESLIKASQEQMLTSDKVCEMLEIGKSKLYQLDKAGVTIPHFLDAGSKSKYYLLSEILTIFTKQKFNKL